jgi:hypothetical protein
VENELQLPIGIPSPLASTWLAEEDAEEVPSQTKPDKIPALLMGKTTVIISSLNAAEIPHGT